MVRDYEIDRMPRSRKAPGAAEHLDRTQRDIAHQPDVGHVPSVSERFCNNAELAPAQIVRRRLAHPEGGAQKNIDPSLTTPRHGAPQEIADKLRAITAACALHC